jgi:hypothetical protein
MGRDYTDIPYMWLEKEADWLTQVGSRLTYMLERAQRQKQLVWVLVVDITRAVSQIHAN